MSRKFERILYYCLCRFMAAEWRIKRKFLSHSPPADLISPCDFFKGFAFKNAHGQKNLFSFLAIKLKFFYYYFAVLWRRNGDFL